MKNIGNLMQQDISNQANNLITRMYCEERGLDYNQVMHSAYYQQLAHIRQHAQMQQEQRMIKNYYQRNGGSFMAKIRDAFAPEENDFGMAAPVYGTPASFAQPFGQAFPSPQPFHQQQYPMAQGFMPGQAFAQPPVVSDPAPLAFVSAEEAQAFEDFKKWQAANADLPKQHQQHQSFSTDGHQNTNM